MTDEYSVRIRPGELADLPRIVEIRNYYIENTHITFDIRPFTTEKRSEWFREHSSGGRCRLLVAQDKGSGVVGYATTGRFRPKEAYETTVEVSIACSPNATGKGIGSRLYRELLGMLSGEDIHRKVAGIAQPNAASNALHERFGFRAIGTFTEVGRKFGRYWDVMWMEKKMTGAQESGEDR